MDPLAQLQDIHLPEQVHNWPIAIGWWLLGITLILFTSFLIWRYFKQKKLNRIKKKALLLINNEQHTPAELITILKWACMHYFPRTDIANKHGEQLAAFLTESLPEKEQSDFMQMIGPLLSAHYKKHIDEQTQNILQQQIVMWLKLALPPQNNRNSSIGGQ